ncbi:ubiquitin carboxyl-terminal hydrolase 31-like [Uloborus diversus]|uniref:ubiquitin carboxyl-terminal hydrolase 31-like n=1 Tax=Uloborus diversus TaxID=327109 RepID=UPI00240A7303|nr:ubiquitin carboxyl-terminal hydrolase 31-like [Uloborus diversus]
MQSANTTHSAISASDGNLTDVEQVEKNGEANESFMRDVDRQALFTIPRWMSGRRKSRNKIKYVKVDVPFTSESPSTENKDDISKSKKKSSDKSKNFFTKLFRRNSTRSKPPADAIPKSPSSLFYLISASNSDIRSSNSIFFHSFDYHEIFKDKIPAVCGIKNHGNTCFMNAVIQCLSSNDSFAEYFVMDHYKMDFMRRNKVHCKKYGTHGEVTQQLAALLKSLWSCQYYSSISEKFKISVAKYGSQYEGSEQHDAQEFLLWLLDKVHEDMNTAPKQKYKKTKASLGRSDEEIAAETLANHLRCNNSFVHDMFQGQFRSSLCCLGCGRFSNTFDPYLCISLPVPDCQSIPVSVFLVLLRERTKMVKVSLLIDSQATVKELREKLNSNFGISEKNTLFVEIIEGKFLRTFSDVDLVTCLNESQDIYAIETPPSTPDSEREKLVMVIVCKLETGKVYHLFWKPFVLDVLRESSYKELQFQIIAALSTVIKETIDLDAENPFTLYVEDQSTYECLCSSVDLPLYMPVIDQALSSCHEHPKHLKLCLEWKENAKNILKLNVPFIDHHSSVSAIADLKKLSNEVTLHECFELYFNEERLGNEDAWMCPYCHHRLPCVKQLSLWTVPDVLIIHLKRFKQAFCQRTKITTFVEFPSSGLDMNPYIASRNQSNHAQSNSLQFWSPWKRSRAASYMKHEDNVYELYGVCNHYGSMQGGHYTAYCRNPVTGHWYMYDDTKVQEVQASDVVSTDAYILFYQRSTFSTQSCASSSSSGYSSASSSFFVGPDHWAFRMPPFLRDGPMTSKSQDNLYDVGNTSSLDRRSSSLHRPLNRGSKAYSTMNPSIERKTAVVKPSVNAKQDTIESKTDSKTNGVFEQPPPPPPAKHYWTVTSV